MEKVKEVKVVILGLGNRGKNYGGHLANTPGVKIVAICDKYQEFSQFLPY